VAIPTISVVIPAYNAGKYIVSAVESVLTQDLIDYEIIVVDDGSTDNTLDQLNSVDDPRLRVLTQKNAGVSSARNLGIANAVAKYIYFLDADDLLRPQTFTRCVKAMTQNHNVSLVYGEAQTFIDGQEPVLKQNQPIFAKRPSGDVSKEIVIANCIACGSAVMVRSFNIKSTGGFSSLLRLGEDWVMWVELAALGEFVYLPAPAICFYRQHQKSAARTLAVDVNEMTPAINHIYQLPSVTNTHPASFLHSAKKQATANALCYSAQEMLKQRQWRGARTLYFRAIKRRPFHLRTLILFCCASLRFVPRFIGNKLK
jgi:glycosyltransferase involved in cell wall biosynthesis